MEKIICALWKAAGESREEFNARLCADVTAQLRAIGAERMRLNIEDGHTAPAAALRQSRGEAQHDALLQFWLPNAHGPFWESIGRVLSQAADRWAAWLVLEATIIPNDDYPAKPGQRSFGWSQTAFLTLPKGMAQEDWRRIWQEDHTRVAVETQANFEYVQNLVIRPLTPDAPPYVAIVEECFPDAAMTDPLAFFDAVGDKAKFKRNLDQMMASCDRFIARGTIDVIPTSQYNF
ncbi:MAG: EthD domain-containing protein [Chakrabartia sp.]